jgi:hypothetical protein
MIVWLQLHLVYLSYNSVKNLSFERPEDDGFVLHRIHNKSLARLYKSSSYVVNGSYSYYKAIPTIKFSYSVHIHWSQVIEIFLRNKRHTFTTK